MSPDAATGGVSKSPLGSDSAEIAVQTPEFAELPESNTSHAAAPIERFGDVCVDLWAELGRVTLPIGDLMRINQGSVLKLNRSVTEPVDLVVQGVKVARGVVVVVDDCFAVRIRELVDRKT
jgi:flagellar motor switch protein FliN/FliY